ncbi:MAG: 16S rRNA (guanine(966)-N(2))-methyltransferase RsmD [Lachnospiraceae bacterium]|jgi:16S rRNA (guanine966-N2)-methyltransferase|nr:16S rRNA (guanine(966)-N(2))-methyltransferase RsmD [Lachnospiraceae bacterium]
MRVIGGSARSLKLKTPPGLHTRPTTDRIKETLFNMIADKVPDSIFCDMFSGSGAIGIEALSRGAKRAYFIDNRMDCIRCMEENLRFTKLFNKGEIFKKDAFMFVKDWKGKESPTILFMDPPYEQGLEREMLNLLYESSFVTENTCIIVETSLHNPFFHKGYEGFRIIKQKKYKTNQHIFLQR